jgi:rhomboid protease GluP
LRHARRALSMFLLESSSTGPILGHGHHALPSFFSNEDRRDAEPSVPKIQARTFMGFDSIKDEFLSADRLLTSSIIGLNILVYAAEYFLGAGGIFASFAQVNVLVWKGQFYRILTAAFLHSGFFHLLGNMLSLHWIGPDLERVVGKGLFLFVFLSSAMGGGLAHLAFGSPYAVLVGASAAVLGLLASLVTLKLQNPTYYPFTASDGNWLGQIVALNLAIAFLSGGSISHLGHLGGVIGGAGAMYLFGPRYRYGRRGEGVVNKPIIPLFK